VARNRKRARDRRAPRPANTAGVATASGDQAEPDGTPLDAPEPLAHATPDSELAEAQLAAARPDPDEVPDEEELEAFEEASDQQPVAAGRRAGSVAAPAHPVERESLPARTATFVRGSWRELQRVQWPDRRQVMQATSVVIGFVIVAGVFLGVADVVAQKIVNLILYGHG
jgi:preprotein translocase subunit SecE